MIKKQKLTSWEWEALVSKVNLADGHAHQAQNADQKRIINSLPQLFDLSETKSQELIQEDFAKHFFHEAGQLYYKYLPVPQYHPACSISIEVIANFLRLNNKSLTLIHPTFDNLPDIFRRHDIKLVSIEEDDLTDQEKLSKITTDALMIVCPNNPTGQELSKKEFENIVKVCKKKKIILIIDFSFRLYSSYKLWDQYEILYKSGINFIVLEDTGKSFPTLDLKLGMLISDKSINESLSDITNDFLLNVSPFIFVLLTEYIKAEESRVDRSFKQVISDNRKKLIEKFTDTSFEIQNPGSNVSVAWIKVPAGKNSGELCKWLETKGIYVLPGNPFFWNSPRRGNSFFRVALARPVEVFDKNATKLVKACREFVKS